MRTRNIINREYSVINDLKHDLLGLTYEEIRKNIGYKNAQTARVMLSMLRSSGVPIESKWVDGVKRFKISEGATL